MALYLGVVWVHRADERFSVLARGKLCAFYFNVSLAAVIIAQIKIT